MPISQHLLRKLEQAFGREAAEELVSLISASETLRGDVAELRHEMQLGFARVEKLIEQRSADLMKWSFLFWIGAVAAIAGLAGVLR